MSISDLRRRLDKVEARHRQPEHRGAIQIITRDDADAERQIAAIVAAGGPGPGILMIDRRIVVPGPRRHQ
ncbi:hypothetical protein [Methylobacterium thuringiense]|uniref:Uncharacterized protein n=1 Tax=Methylobacterium thuringiense TaxID=1003091 RepID=A0ABQ4TSW8_9HYPH|nr:hypothetical protein [Methylobacterium thuringiense]GJE57753.1 hypothetical protein EKPJFOCH_4271 [Methylobacterium thuringiense]